MHMQMHNMGHVKPALPRLTCLPKRTAGPGGCSGHQEGDDRPSARPCRHGPGQFSCPGPLRSAAGYIPDYIVLTMRPAAAGP
jgi:hypothetical protein